MASNKKPRKKYSPRRTPFIGTRTPPYEIALSRTSREPLTEAQIERATTGYKNLIKALPAGECTDQIFWEACENHYLYTHLALVLINAEINADDQTKLLAKLEFDVALNTCTEKTAEVFESISARKIARNTWGATGDELKHLEEQYNRFKALLGIANFSHYIQAYELSEPELDAIAHRKRKAHNGAKQWITRQSA